MVILDGKKLSEKILKDLKRKIGNKRLNLAVIFVGDDSVSKIYVREKEKACQKVGIGFELFNFSSEIKKEELKKEIIKLAEDKNISGIVIQLPLPEFLDREEILNLIPEKKDIDVLSKVSFQKFKRGELPILPPVVCAVKKLLEEYKISLNGKKIVLVGKGRLVGKPLSVWLKNMGANFSVVDKSTPDIFEITKEADIIISGAGKPNLITGDMVKQGAVVIDAGISCLGGKSTGDVDFESVSKKAKYITPVPGGIGPMTVVCLLQNLIRLSDKNIL